MRSTIAGLTVLSFVIPGQPVLAECGIASHYHEGKRTANGERFEPDGLSAAHKSLPFGTIVRVKHQRTGRSIEIRINDRGPFVPGRIIDLSRGAARLIGINGLAPVCIDVVR
jgi:rare lipoprotein A